MKVRMTVSIAGNAEPRYELPEFSFAPGDEVELHPELAAAWIAAGHAEAMAKPRARRAAVAVDDTQPQDAQGSD